MPLIYQTVWQSMEVNLASILKTLFVHNFYYLLTQPFEKKRNNDFLSFAVGSLPFFCFLLLYQYKIVIADVSMGGRQEEKTFYYRTIPLSERLLLLFQPINIFVVSKMYPSHK